MAFMDNYDFFNLKNESENFVLNELSRQLQNYAAPVCLCNDCVVDMAAVALNNVKPFYRVSLLGSLYTASMMDEKSYASSVRDAVFNAIEKVRKNPSHDVDMDE